MSDETAPALVDPKGRPAKVDRSCPGTLPSGRRCGAGPDKRVLSAGFGEPHPVCSQCGHEFTE